MTLAGNSISSLGFTLNVPGASVSETLSGIESNVKVDLLPGEIIPLLFSYTSTESVVLTSSFTSAFTFENFDVMVSLTSVEIEFASDSAAVLNSSSSGLSFGIGPANSNVSFSSILGGSTTITGPGMLISQPFSSPLVFDTLPPIFANPVSLSGSLSNIDFPNSASLDSTLSILPFQSITLFDGNVGGDDITLTLSAAGGLSDSLELSAIPEPGTLGLVLLAFSGVVRRRRGETSQDTNKP